MTISSDSFHLKDVTFLNFNVPLIFKGYDVPDNSSPVGKFISIGFTSPCLKGNSIFDFAKTFEDMGNFSLYFNPEKIICEGDSFL